MRLIEEISTNKIHIEEEENFKFAYGVNDLSHIAVLIKFKRSPDDSRRFMLFVPFLLLTAKYALEPGLFDSLSCAALDLSLIFHL